MGALPITRRCAALAMVVVGHVAVVSAFAFGGTVEVVARPATIALYDVPSPSIAAARPVVTFADIPVDVTAPVVDVADAMPAPSDADCALIDRLTTALTDDSAVDRALAALPPERTSMANAVMAWDGRWVEAPAPVRRIVIDYLRGSPAACRAVPITGPRLLIVPAGKRPVVLAFGSGRWRWDDLLAGDGAADSKIISG